MWELDYKEGLGLKNWYLWTVVLMKTLEKLLDWKKIKQVNSKGNQPWILIGGSDAEAEAPILWPPDAMCWFIGKDPDAGKDWGQEEKGMTEEEMVRWHHLLNGSEKAMASHFSTLAWKIPWMEEPGRLQSMGSLGVGHDWATSLSLFSFMHWRRKWQPSPVVLLGESQRQGSLVGCRLWGRTESDTTEAT